MLTEVYVSLNILKEYIRTCKLVKEGAKRGSKRTQLNKYRPARDKNQKSLNLSTRMS